MTPLISPTINGHFFSLLDRFLDRQPARNKRKKYRRRVSVYDKPTKKYAHESKKRRIMAATSRRINRQKDWKK